LGLPKLINLMPGNHAGPTPKIGVWVELAELAPQNNADFLKHLLGARDICQDGHQIRVQPAMMLGKYPGKRLALAFFALHQ
jgi:hypothetical protein